MSNLVKVNSQQEACKTPYRPDGYFTVSLLTNVTQHASNGQTYAY
jgi:hypothetical protein